MTVYLRTYGSMKDQPESKRISDICNNVVKKCVEELKRQGIDVQLAHFGDKQLVDFDSECNKIVPRFKHNIECDFHDNEVCLKTKVLKTVRYRVPMQRDRNFDYMTVEAVMTAYKQYGIVYECNGDFTSIHKEVEF